MRPHFAGALPGSGARDSRSGGMRQGSLIRCRMLSSCTGRLARPSRAHVLFQRHGELDSTIIMIDPTSESLCRVATHRQWSASLTHHPLEHQDTGSHLSCGMPDDPSRVIRKPLTESLAQALLRPTGHSSAHTLSQLLLQVLHAPAPSARARRPSAPGACRGQRGLEPEGLGALLEGSEVARAAGLGVLAAPRHRHSARRVHPGRTSCKRPRVKHRPAQPASRVVAHPGHGTTQRTFVTSASSLLAGQPRAAAQTL
eukprot:1598131-Rhodomonas_salina.1